MREDALQIKSIVNDLEKQDQAAKHIIPIMESENRTVQDSLKFILDFNSFTTTPIFVKRNNTWDFLTSSGVLSEFPDQELLKLLQNYYNNFNDLAINFTKSGNPVRLELRKLKYELFKNSEHSKFFPTQNPQPPGKEVYEAIFNDGRMLPLCRYIGSTATYFEFQLGGLEQKAQHIIEYLETNYRPSNQ